MEKLLTALSLCLFVAVTGVTAAETGQGGRGKNPPPFPGGNVPSLRAAGQKPGAELGGAGMESTYERSEPEATPAPSEGEDKGLPERNKFFFDFPAMRNFLENIDTKAFSEPQTGPENNLPGAGNGGQTTTTD